MWIFITARIRQWVLLAVIIPLAAMIVHVIRTAIEKKTGSTKLTRALTTIEELGRRRTRRGRAAAKSRR